MSETGIFKDLKYVISERAPFIVVTFSGSIDDSNEAVLKKLMSELLIKSGFRFFVLQLATVSAATDEGLRAFTILQNNLRNTPAEIRLVGLHSDLKSHLIKMGVVRMLEIRETLDVALLDLRRKSLQPSQDTAKKVY